MTVTVNGAPREFPEASLTISELLAVLELVNHPVLVELNGDAVLQREFDRAKIADGDKLEIIRMVAGG